MTYNNTEYKSNQNGKGTGFGDDDITFSNDEEFGYRPLRRRTSVIKSYVESSDSEIEEEDEEEEGISFKKHTKPNYTNGNGNGVSKPSFPVRLKIGKSAAKLVEMRNLRSSSRRNHIRDDEDDDEHMENGIVKDEDEDENDIDVVKEESDHGNELERKDDDDDDDDAIIPRRRPSRKSITMTTTTITRSTRSRSRRHGNDDEEEEYQELDDEENEDVSDNSRHNRSDTDDSFETMNNKSLDRGFIVSDEEDSDSHKRKRRRQKLAQRAKASRRNRQSRRRHANDDDDSEYESDGGVEAEAEEDDVATLKEELRELRESATPPPEPVRKLQLRERKEVNYQILPPPLPDESFDTVPVSPGRNAGRRRGGGAGPIRRLFPTTGPFGGNDVISVFGGGVGKLPGLPGALGGQPGGPDPTAIIDSDSSDDDLLGAGGGAASSKSKNNATGVSQFGIVKPKKPGLADSDPLGVDMNIDFSAVGGLDNYINQLKEMVTLPLRYPEIYQRFAITPPRGVLFHGPPGTGKTLMARALAASCSHEGKKITFFMRKGADCLSKWVGEAERQLRILFEEARNQQPSIIFFDEIDGLAPVRSSKQEQIHASIVSTLLALMDGMDNRGQVIVIGATNRPDSVDPALRRPGRFDREFYFPLPDLEARKKIIGIHTSKWDPPLKPNFIDHVAELTKGYGGADLRALCTEAALNSIQRRYPQIYMSNEKLLLDPQSIHVTPADFMKSVDKIIPSSARSTSSGAAPLPTRIEPLLGDSFKRIVVKLDNLLPRTKKLTALEEALYEDIADTDGGFARQEALKNFQTARVFRPRLLVCGEVGMGQQYIGAAILHHLEGFHVQSFDLGTLFSDSTRTPEAALIQLFVEARRHTPSVVYLPNVETWFATISDAAKSTFRSILRNINPTESILVLGMSDIPHEELDPQLKDLFGYSSESYEELTPVTSECSLAEFFKILRYYISSKPTDYPDPDKRRKRVLEKLEIAPPPPENIPSKSELKQLEKKDMQLKNLLKFKLSGLMDLFKNRYKRFKKPPIEDIHLVHLFEPSPPELNIQPAFVRDGDKILEVATGKRFFNIDLDIIEERLWNGFYSEPKQYLKDIEMISVDAITTGDRERMIKASEMVANAQVVIDEICGDSQFIQACKDMHQREIAKQKRLAGEMNGDINGTIVTPIVVGDEDVVVPVPGVVGEPGPEPEVEGKAKPESDPVEGPVDEDVEMEEANDSAPVKEAAATGDEKQINVVPEPVESDSKTEPTPEPEPEPPEPEPEPESEPDLILDEKLLSEFEARLIKECTKNELVVEQLEHINTCLVDTIWKHKQLWDRNAIIGELHRSLDEVLKAVTAVNND